MLEHRWTTWWWGWEELKERKTLLDQRSFPRSCEAPDVMGPWAVGRTPYMPPPAETLNTASMISTVYGISQYAKKVHIVFLEEKKKELAGSKVHWAQKGKNHTILCFKIPPNPFLDASNLLRFPQPQLPHAQSLHRARNASPTPV